jgi:hypothetical protein
MPDTIDFAFISALEGGSVTVGYVPAPGVSKSGVTVATGFDLGQRSESDLKALGLSTTLITKLKPHLGKQGKAASEFLVKNSLTLTIGETVEIDKAVRSETVKALKLKYLSAASNTAGTEFFDLPAEAQTVIASVAFQYGASLDIRAPEFWKIVTAQEWAKAVELLSDFKDAYPTRRKKEAGLLSGILPKKDSSGEVKK